MPQPSTTSNAEDSINLTDLIKESHSEFECPQHESSISTLLSDDESEANRILQICNACRYCEGFCAMFPAMTQRLEFAKADINYLANLCHNCGSCLHSCQYAEPHEFRVNVPATMARVRLQTYTEYAWPKWAGKLYQKNGLAMSIASAVGLSLFFMLALILNGSIFHPPLQGNFYEIFSHNLMVSIFGIVFGFAILSLAIGTLRFYRDISPGAQTHRTLRQALKDVLSLRYLDGGHGEGCTNNDDAYTLWRRRFHHLTFYGFMLCFAATSTGTIYHYVFGWVAPYDYFSLPVIFGTTGGIGLLIGPAGMFYLNLTRHPLHGDPQQKPMDLGFIALLFIISLSGLLLLLLRNTSSMGLLLAIHLGTVLGLFLTMPYGKFAHGFYRTVALLKWAKERPDTQEQLHQSS